MAKSDRNRKQNRIGQQLLTKRPQTVQVREITISPGQVLKATEVFDTYWRFAAMRQTLFMRRVAGALPPWTDDPVLSTYRFTNAYRAADRVSQYLIRNVIYAGEQTGEEIFFRTLLFKLFNRIETWEQLNFKIGPITWKAFDFDTYARILDSIARDRGPIYSGAYIMPSPALGYSRKHRNHLRLLERIMLDGAPLRIERARSLREVYQSFIHTRPWDRSSRCNLQLILTTAQCWTFPRWSLL
jgi:hypothetical protein